MGSNFLGVDERGIQTGLWNANYFLSLLLWAMHVKLELLEFFIAAFDKARKQEKINPLEYGSIPREEEQNSRC